MKSRPPAFSQDHDALLASLAATPDLLLIQDLDGVCMELVRDPLTRRIERRYLDAAHALNGSFQVLTNGEHIGTRGVNAIVDRVFDADAGTHGRYLPGLAAGGVQHQDRHGQVRHPGVSEAELAFLQTVPMRATRFLSSLLLGAPYHVEPHQLASLVHAAVLDNPASPTLNLNVLHRHFDAQPGLYAQLQRQVQAFGQSLLHDAHAEGLEGAFFIHYAPNLGRDADGVERLKPADAHSAGTTDFQCMLTGAVKETGVLALLNQHIHQRSGRWPLGEDFNVRRAPRSIDALVALAKEKIEPTDMPRIVGVGDTVTSVAQTVDGQTQWLRGGSDRGFLTLIQRLGEAFGTDNRVLYIDSSGGEVLRPALDAAQLRRSADDASLSAHEAAAGITDADDPLRLDVVFPGGHAQYVDFFCALAQRRGA
ncbi:glucosylglycerol 3-phosphatase [Pseudoxanthomonas sp.]|uniref:glucosylglycerol 3-phosphatase n=1 Tax=Pseudoxanthomonas sp. TaxID=1871049 RepID=UPI0026268E3D|nr:glucosylglycerol 3-phosphatase [Pseudoxanthomonas sp.]WDS34930.1 MAG: glucosylglycerol 3-phosphatase [Pseudoxanthomonas sp.]